MSARAWTMLEIDGSRGEGGGQVVRTAVALAAATGTSLRVENVRASRSSPGLRPQHRTAVEACAAICGAETEGVERGARAFTFRDPGRPRAGRWQWSVGTAGSATLVLQTVLPPLICADGPSEVVVEGGTHTLKAPIWEHLADSYLPAVERTGTELETTLERHGFYPAGGGRIRMGVDPPTGDLDPLVIPERGDLRELDVTAILADLPGHIARRELETFADAVAVYQFGRHVDAVESARSPGNALYASISSDAGTAILSEMGRKGRPAEDVAVALADRTRNYLESGAAIEPHLADQLVVPVALAGAGSFATSEITDHCRTQLDLVGEFVDVEFTSRPLASGAGTEIAAR